MYKYTIGFIRKGSSLLMLNREKPPIMGLWHGVGGKIESGETPKECMIREVYEETGISIKDAQYKGKVSWVSDGERYGGMFAYIIDMDKDIRLSTPKSTSEGILDWKEIDWLLNSNNLGVPKHLPYFLPSLLEDHQLYEHQFVMNNKDVIDYKKEMIE